MNFITYNGAYSLFPRATFEERKGLIFRTPCDPSEALAKYMSRGWDLRDTITDEEQSNLASSLRAETRWVGDKKSWIFRFKVVSPNLENDFDPAVLNSFSIIRARANRPEPATEVQFAFIRHRYFDGCYAASFCLVRKLNYFFEKLAEEGVRLSRVGS